MHHDRQEILLIDDRKENLELLSSFLLHKGYKIRSALSGVMALQSIAAKKPDLILLDIEMPERNGYEVCKELKADPETEAIPIIFISAHDDTEAKIKAFPSGEKQTSPSQRPEFIGFLNLIFGANLPSPLFLR